MILLILKIIGILAIVFIAIRIYLAIRTYCLMVNRLHDGWLNKDQKTTKNNKEEKE